MPWFLRHRIVTPLLAVVGVAVVCAVVWVGDPTTPGGFLPPCPTAVLLHLDCPVCGSTRMLYALLHGDLGAALRYNALGVMVTVLLVIAFATYVVGLWRGRRIRTWLSWRYTPLVAGIVAAAWFVVRAVPVGPFTGLAV
ncbi:membrane protein [Gordonia phthalatica]|uniref:Membrane protein n=1 Tax=Gordonia phthalatica TaxID=1136941 RepID=A0A0N9NHC2_9ACTN|nr:membrane protein [Gordonia phthalatica]